MILELTDAAVSDLQSIRNYTLEQWGKRQETAYLDAMWEKFEEILSNPGRWRKREDLFPGCQIAAQAKHVILFRIQGKTLQVVRILHSAMDYPRHVPPDLG
jgi:toxin ParE1/3/4